MTTHCLPYPAELVRNLQGVLPRQTCWGMLCVRVTPRDGAYRKCAAYEADHYEVQAFYTTMSPDPLDQLEAALAELPGVYKTTQLREVDRGTNMLGNPTWPAALGQRRRGFHDLRPQVLALIRD
jgi:hypothetical protein